MDIDRQTDRQIGTGSLGSLPAKWKWRASLDHVLPHLHLLFRSFGGRDVGAGIWDQGYRSRDVLP